MKTVYSFIYAPFAAGDAVLHGFATTMKELKENDNFELEPFKKLCTETSAKILVTQIALGMGLIRRALMYGHMVSILTEAGVPRPLAMDTIKVLWNGERAMRKHFQK